MHRSLKNIPNGDVLIHAGDLSDVGERNQIEGFVKWFKEQPHTHKIFIAGNHDRSFDPKFNKEPNPYWDIETASKFNTTKPFWLQDLLKSLEGTNVHYLEDSGVTIDGVKFWGSPWTPWFHGDHWAFNKQRGAELKEVWNQIPFDADVVVSHGGAARTGMLNVTADYLEVGCEDLKSVISKLPNLKLHVHGHIHEGGGYFQNGNVLHLNASVVNERYNVVRDPIEINLSKDGAEIL
jgi:calcineurin-like phosphoesterase family protein